MNDNTYDLVRMLINKENELAVLKREMLSLSELLDAKDSKMLESDYHYMSATSAALHLHGIVDTGAIREIFHLYPGAELKRKLNQYSAEQTVMVMQEEEAQKQRDSEEAPEPKKGIVAAYRDSKGDTAHDE